MGKLILSAIFVLIVITIYFFADDQVDNNQPQKNSLAVTNTSNNIAILKNEKNDVPQNSSNNHKRPKILSSDATAAYKKALKFGWSSIVDDFENNLIQTSNMSEDEKNKLCDLTIINVSKNDLIRLLNSNCQPTGMYVSNLIINKNLKNNQGQIDQQEIIQKLQLLKNKGVLQLKNTYDSNLKENKFGKIDISLFDKAVSIGANDVIDYAISIGSLPTARKSPIFTQISGNPSATTIKKLLTMGYLSDQNTINYMSTYNFKDKHPDIYELLQ